LGARDHRFESYSPYQFSEVYMPIEELKLIEIIICGVIIGNGLTMILEGLLGLLGKRR
jgi:hypothetical protein